MCLFQPEPGEKKPAKGESHPNEIHQNSSFAVKRAILQPTGNDPLVSHKVKPCQWLTPEPTAPRRRQAGDGSPPGYKILYFSSLKTEIISDPRFFPTVTDRCFDGWRYTVDVSASRASERWLELQLCGVVSRAVPHVVRGGIRNSSHFHCNAPELGRRRSLRRVVG